MGLFDIFKKKKLEDGLEKTRTGFFQQIVRSEDHTSELQSQR